VFERFTDRARRVMVLGQEEARLLNHNYIGTEHLLLALFDNGAPVAGASAILVDAGAGYPDIKDRVASKLAKYH
jgi:ATP-dependent Clp protease ATP-binding subunit ClpC